MPIDSVSGVYYEVHGDGAPVMITLPLMASHIAIFGPAGEAVLRGYLDRLTDRYRVLLIDYPSIGRSRDIVPEDLTADRVCADLLDVATAAGFDRFAYWGYSWGGAVGLQLAARTDRLTALAIGGWPPLGAPYANILEASRRRIGHVESSARVVLRNDDQYRQWSYYYASMIDWRETEEVGRIDCPRLVYFGGEGDLVEAGLPVNIASTIRSHRDTLQDQGWIVSEFAGHGHGVCLEADLIVPPILSFLDKALGL